MVNRGAAAACRSSADHAARCMRERSNARADRARPQAQVGESAPWVVRTALCVEPRDGRLHVFMPPLAIAEDYVDLLAAIEDTAAHLEMPVVIEGYTPPYDPRIKHIKVTPDPGVIEVNIHPARNWQELVEHTTDALRGRAAVRGWAPRNSCWTAGIPAPAAAIISCSARPTPADSPFLRRPDLLRSMLGYWLNHPSLSYLFSGMFIGPTSQAPRVDETRAGQPLRTGNRVQPDSRAAAKAIVPPWLVDRIFRHILVDVTGNTHRAEFCIDKLYSPDSSTGRLGLLELRGFEMPPHARMSLTQQLLVRALIAWFWKRAVSSATADSLGNASARPVHAAVFRRAGFPATCSRI